MKILACTMIGVNHEALGKTYKSRLVLGIENGNMRPRRSPDGASARGTLVGRNRRGALFSFSEML